ncbi:MAG: S9 family peptidase, partial [Phycisphaerales bacterium]
IWLMSIPACMEPAGGYEAEQDRDGKVPASEAELESFLAIRAPYGGRLSPDGTLYYMKRAEEAYQIFARSDTAGAKAERLTDFEDGVGGFSLSPDGRHIVITAGKGGDEQNDVYLMPTETREIRPLLIDRSVVYGSAEWRRDSSGFAYRANEKAPRDFHVYDYDLASGRSRLLFESEGMNAPADWTRDGRRLLVSKMHSASHQQIFEVDVASGEAREVTPRGVQRRFRVVGYTADENEVLVVTDYLGNFTNLALLDLEPGEVRPALSEFERHDVDRARLNEDRSVLAAVINEDGYGRLILRNMADMSAMPTPRMAKGLVSGLWFTDQTMLFSVYNPQNPGRIVAWSYRQPKRAPRVLAVPEDGGIDLRTFVLPKLVRYTSFDGLEIPALLYLPRNYKRGEPCPFIVHFHGGPEGQARPGMQVYLQYFLSRGLGIIQPNVRGSTGYGTEYMNLDNYERRMDSVRDGLAAARWLIKKGYATKGRIGAFGGSYGGFMVMAAITEEPELWGAACDLVGIVNFETFLENTKAYRQHLREAEYGPLTDPEFLRSISPIHKVDRITAPLMVVHGRNDPRVPVGEAEQIAAALRERGRPVELLVFDDEGHGIRKQPNRVVYFERLVEFFSEHLKG